MKNLIQKKGIAILLLITLFSLSMSTEVFSQKKKNKEKTSVPRQSVKEEYGKTVTLVTSGTGASEDEATRNALRNAIEQAYGTFVSANTTVVNDELVSDAIASVSSGNVLGYEPISCIDLAEGGCQVSLKAVVSINNLVSFATSRGMTTELAGNTFIQNRKLAQLNKENEMKALYNLVKQLEMISAQGFDFSINVGKPKPVNNGELYSIDINISASPNKNLELFWETIDKTLSSLSMSDTESANYATLGLSTYTYCYVPTSPRFPILPAGSWQGKKSTYKLRTNIGKATQVGKPLTTKETELPVLQGIYSLTQNGNRCYEVYDNIGTVYSPITTQSNNQVYFKGDTGEGAYISTYDRGKADFLLLYTESQLSQLQKISVRPAFTK